jgi:glyoxylase-like metal-dependent hydrolase (beta-lactamase superfamily II)
MQRIVSGVYALPLEYEFMGEQRTITPAAVETDRGLVLVDAGLPSHVDAIEAHLSDAGFAVADVATVLVTHQDADHAGGLANIAARADAAVVAHVDDAPYIAGDCHPIKSEDGERYPSTPVDVEVVEGVRFRTAAGAMRVVATPGHTPGHISLYFPKQRLLLAADALTAEEEFGGPNEPFTPEMETAVESIGRLAGLDVERTLCYHGGLVEHAPDRIDAIHDSLRS